MKIFSTRSAQVAQVTFTFQVLLRLLAPFVSDGHVSQLGALLFLLPLELVIIANHLLLRQRQFLVGVAELFDHRLF